MAMQNVQQEPMNDEELLKALEDAQPVQLPLFPDWPDDADDTLETAVRRNGGRLPGSDPRR